MKEPCYVDKIMVVDCGDEVRLFFDPADYSPAEKDIKRTIGSFSFSNQCSGGCSERLHRGDVRIFFNPLIHTESGKSFIIKKIIEVIKKPDPERLLSHTL